MYLRCLRPISLKSLVLTSINHEHPILLCYVMLCYLFLSLLIDPRRRGHCPDYSWTIATIPGPCIAPGQLQLRVRIDHGHNARLEASSSIAWVSVGVWHHFGDRKRGASHWINKCLLNSPRSYLQVWADLILAERRGVGRGGAIFSITEMASMKPQFLKL